MRLIQFFGASKGSNNNNNSSSNSSSSSMSSEERHTDSASTNLCGTLTGNSSSQNEGVKSCTDGDGDGDGEGEESWSEYDESPQEPLTTANQHSHLPHYHHRPPLPPPSDDSPNNDADDENDENDSNQQIRFLNADDGVGCGRITPLHHHSRLSKSKSSKSKTHTDDDALQFNIGVTLNGRNYTVIRALPSFVKLRRDVMAEISDLRMGTTTTTHPQQPNKSGCCSESETIPDLPIGHTRSSHSSHSSTGTNHDHNDNGIFDDLEGRARAVAGFAGRGFSRLQAALCTLCPEMEEWLRAVAMLCPASPSLANFLWEAPNMADGGFVETKKVDGGVQMQQQQGGNGGVEETMVRKNCSVGSLGALNAITESESEEESECEWGSEDEGGS